MAKSFCCLNLLFGTKPLENMKSTQGLKCFKKIIMHNFAFDCKYVNKLFKTIKAGEEEVGPRLLYLPFLHCTPQLRLPNLPFLPYLPTSLLPYFAPGHASRVLGPFFLGFRSLALLRLQNIEHCCVVSLYFSRSLPLKNFDPGLFSLPPPVQLPLPIFSRIPTPFLTPSSFKWHLLEPSYDPIAGQLHQLSWKPLS